MRMYSPTKRTANCTIGLARNVAQRPPRSTRLPLSQARTPPGQQVRQCLLQGYRGGPTRTFAKLGRIGAQDRNVAWSQACRIDLDRDARARCEAKQSLQQVAYRAAPTAPDVVNLP